MRRPLSVSRRGSALVFALWIALLIGVLGTVALRLAAHGAGAAQIEADLAQARSAAESGVWFAAHRMATLDPGLRPPQASFRLELGGSQVAVQATDEDGRLDINAAPEPLLTAMFRVAGVAEQDAAALAARVVEWRDPNTGLRIRQVGSMNDSQNRARFRTAGDIGSVPGVGMALAERLRDGMTVHTGNPWPARLSAPPLTQTILAQFMQDQGLAPLRQDGFRTPAPAQSGAGRRMILRITAHARRGMVDAYVTAVIHATAWKGMPGRVLEWDAASRPSQ
ncbi:type II secretion system protein GspK [Roseomonas marmotae]|uniref:General secretion pathway protein GspK n=1 Tax=Roseomonas marmotae TaxID=2768161 RepID=A0ABS3KC24_9PROT|nr:type II secretion system protein GspK [Roseomonas marmotae]MBO1075026.1 general secretion pathway protein GspK [Roseomonas marmotae]QTI79939.1 general secretion pathway protein GspK [Roseomonas marmotae]